MAERRRSGKLAVILHADVAGSTDLVRQDEQLAHDRIQDTFRRFGDTISKYHGSVRELRGDALLAEFERASDAVTAALAFQDDQLKYLSSLNDAIQPSVRVGIAMGEVIIADDTITGEGVVLAQRLEQLAEPGGVVIQGAAYETIPGRFPFEYENLGEHEVKGFDEPVKVYAARLKGGIDLPQPAPIVHRTRNTIIAFASVAVVSAGVALMWFKPWEIREEPASVERMAFPLPNKPSIAVLPFDNLSGDEEQEYFSDGITNDIITDLSKFKNLFVIASNSTFTYKGKPVKVQQVAEDLGVRYVLEGSVQTTADRIRINAQLIDATSGRHLWAERYDRAAGDMFAVQNEIVETIVSTLAFRVEATERERALRKDTENLDAYENYLRGTVELYRYTKEAHAKAAKLYERAIELDPKYAKAISRLAWVHINAYQWGWSEDAGVSKRRAFELAKKAAALAPDDYFSHWVLGYIYLTQKDFDLSEAAYERARALNSNDAEFLSIMAQALLYLGRPDEAVEEIERAMRLNPHHPEIILADLGWAYYDAGRYEDAVKAYRSMNSPPPWVHRGLAAAYVRLGKLEEARSEITQMLEKEPDYTLEKFRVWPFKHKEDLERWIEDLRKAGVPEKPLLKLPAKPSIAVLPFTNMSGDPEQEYFADGITEDLTTDLSKISGLFVVARNSSFRYKGKSPDVREVSRELGVRYVVEGSVRRVEDQIRINAQLIDATTGGHVWAERFDGTMGNVFSLQDKVNRKIVNALEINLTAEDRRRFGKVETSNPDAYDMLLRGLEQYQRFSLETNIAARELYKQAIALDPQYARAYANVALTYAFDVNFNWTNDREETTRLGLEYATKALEIDDSIPQIYLTRSILYLTQRRYHAAIEAARRTVEVHPHYADGYTSLAFVLSYAGEPGKALEAIRQAMHLNPQYSYIHLATQGRILFLLGRYEEAVVSLQESVRRNPVFDRSQLILAAIYAEMGRLDDAAWAVEEALTINPDISLEAERRMVNYRKRRDLDNWIEALRKAGLPEQ